MIFRAVLMTAHYRKVTAAINNSLASCPGFLHLIAIGNPLKLSPDFPPLSTVHESFPSHGAPSIHILNVLNTIYTLRYSISVPANFLSLFNFTNCFLSKFNNFI